MVDVEDIMCDQCIISPELDVHFGRTSFLVMPASKIRETVELVARAVLPPVSTVFYAFLRNPPQVVLRNVRQEVLPAVVAFLANKISRSLASVQRISLPLTLRIMKDQHGRNQAVITEGAQCSEDPEKSVDCVVLSEPEDVLVDVIFVHGLHGGLDRTWKQGTWRRNGHKLTNQFPVRRLSTGNLYVPQTEQSLKRTISGIYSKIPRKIARKEGRTYATQQDNVWEMEYQDENSDYSNCWPKDWIPRDCPNARVIALNYSTDVLWCPSWTKKRKRTDMVTRSQEMIEELIRLGVGRKPIVWVGHSKGGLFIKQIIVNAWENGQERIDVNDILVQSRAIMWYSVPHKGSVLADFKLPLLRRSVELLEIQRNCNFLADLHQRFVNVLQNFDLEVFSFIETAFTLMFFVYMKVVAYDSADPHVGIKCDVPLDHREICKPAGRDCFLYLELLKLINKSLERCSH
nr:uncharacterized protein LOC111510133 [Leptinotarsa decemlineata]XP_023021775.1 uncharacterized protein LOC111510133 [Leptinotarsa decemlineata]